MLPTFEEYCLLIANVPDQFPSIQSSTLLAYRIGPFAAEVEGRLTFVSGYVLNVWELLDIVVWSHSRLVAWSDYLMIRSWGQATIRSLVPLLLCSPVPL